MVKSHLDNLKITFISLDSSFDLPGPFCDPCTSLVTLESRLYIVVSSWTVPLYALVKRNTGEWSHIWFLVFYEKPNCGDVILNFLDRPAKSI